MSDDQKLDPFALVCALEFVVIRLLADRLAHEPGDVCAERIANMLETARDQRWLLPPGLPEDYPERIVLHLERLLRSVHRMADESRILAKAAPGRAN